MATKAITFLALILPLINIVFNCKHYLQIKGCTTSTICRPSHSNIFMDHFEKKYIYAFLRGISLICLQFMEGIFFIWAGTTEQVANYFNILNKKHNPIKFEHKMSQTSTTFFDIEVSIENKLFTKIYRQNTSFM